MKATYKQWSRQALMALLAAVMVLSMTVFAASSDGTGESGTDTGTETAMPFADVSESAWYYDAVLDAYQQQLMIGTGETTFSPSAGTTRAMVVTTLYRLAGEPDVTGLEMLFEDVVEGRYYYNALLWAYDVGVAEGRSATVFDPNTPITREETVTFFGRYAQYILEEDVASVAAGVDLSGYTDADKVGNYAQGSMSWAVATGLVIGTSATTLSPDRICNRAELATMLSRFCKENVSADDAIVQVTTIAFVDADGPKVEAVVVEYDTELTAGTVDTNSYEVYTYANLPMTYDVGSDNGGDTDGFYETYPSFSYGGDTAGQATNVYVSATAKIDPEGVGDESGKYVIIEVNTDYLLEEASSDWRACLAGGVLQLTDIQAGDVTIRAGTEVQGNYEETYTWDINRFGSNHSVTTYSVLDDSLYTLEDLDGYMIYMNDAEEGGTVTHYASEDLLQYGDRDVTYNTADTTVLSKVAGSAFEATNCYSEYDGEYHDVDLMYCLYVPEDYEEQVAAGKEFMLAVHIIDAGALGTDPMLALTESQAAANYASDEVQQIAKDQGYGGLIVVMPYMTKDDQTVADNLTGNEYVHATWQLLDYLTEEYAIDTNRIYGSGQSMGGMQILYMASQRDNYFAGIWAIGSQWGSNYNKDEVYGNGSNAHSYYTYTYDGEMITNKDWQNWYYSVSDDNILITNMTGDASATGYWTEFLEIIEYYTNYTIPYTEWDPLSLTWAEQSQLLEDLTADSYELGFYWNALSNGSHRATWIYAHGVDYSYEWLLTQTKQSEDERGKIEILKTALDGYNSTGSSYSPTLEVTADDSGFACLVLSDGTVIWEIGTDSCDDLVSDYEVTDEYIALHVTPLSEEEYPYLYPEDGWEMYVYGEQPEWFDAEMYAAAWEAFSEWENTIYNEIFDYEGLRSVTAQDTLDAAPDEDYVVTEEDIAALREYALVTNSLPTNMRTSVLNTLYAAVGRTIATEARAYMNDIGLGSEEGQLDTMTNLMALCDTLGVSNQGVNQTGFYAAIAASYFDIDEYIYYPYATEETYFPYSVCVYLWEHGMVVSQDSDDVWRLHAADDVFNILATVDGSEVAVNKAFAAVIDENNNVYWKVGADNVDAVKSYYGLGDDLVEVQIEPVLEKEDASIVLIDGYNRDATIVFPYLDSNATWTINILNGEIPSWYDEDSEAALMVALEEWKEIVYGGFDFEAAGVDDVFPAETTLTTATYTEEDIELLADWARAWHNVSDQGISLAVSINQTISTYSSANIWDNFDSYLTSLWRDVHVQCPGGCIEAGYERDVPDGNPSTNIGDVVADVMAALGGYYFTGITDWAYYTGDTTEYPYAAGAQLVLKNLVPITDGTNWYFASGEESWIIFTISEEELLANY